MDQRPYRLRSERLAQAVKLDRYKELMPGTEERDSTHVVVSGETADTIESPWGLSSSPHFDTIHKQTTSSHLNLSVSQSLPSFTVSPSLSVLSSLSLANVNSRSRSLYAIVRPSVCLSTTHVCLSSVVCLYVSASILNRLKFFNIFLPFGIPCHHLTFTENFTEIVLEEPLRRGI